MAKEGLDAFVTYYQRELSYLRRSTAEFSQRYPKIARRLELGHGETADPHVERLIETFAYLTGRLQREIDDQYPLISSALLDILYPHLTSLIPPITIAQLADKGGVGKTTDGIVVPKGCSFRAAADQGQYIDFTNCYETHVWPVRLTEATVVATDALEKRLAHAKTSRVLRVRIEETVFPLKTLSLDTLRLYIDGDRATQNLIYQMLFTEDVSVWVQPNADQDIAGDPVKMGCIRPVGFKADELVLVSNAITHPAYALLSEFFHFPQKFMFFDVCDIAMRDAVHAVDIFISIPDRIQIQKALVTQETFKIGCTPIVNLFQKISEPFGLNLRQTEYQVVPDYRQHESMEIHSIQRVYAQSPGASAPEVIPPYFGFDHEGMSADTRKFWHARRKPSKLETGGSDYFVSFVDYALKSDLPPSRVIYADLLCTNRKRARDMPQNCKLIPPLGYEITAIALNKPSPTVYPKIDGETQWKLISHLGLNHISLSGEQDRVEMVREMLNLYLSLVKDLASPEINAIKNVSTRWVTRRMGHEGWRGFVQGTQVELLLNDVAIDGNAGLLLASVLNEFFALSCSVNTFIELVLKIDGREGIWKRWKPNSGARSLL